MNPLSISVVIPTFNGRHLLEANLPFLFKALDKVNIEQEVIIVDDASKDDTMAFLSAQYPNIKAVENLQNLGFSATANKGIRLATQNLVFILNNDVAVLEDYFVHQFRYFEESDTFGVMGKIIGYDDGLVQDTAKYPQVSATNINGTTNYLLSQATPVDFWTPTFFLSGANALIDRRKLQLIGGFDEIFSPFNFEDVELSIRAARLGWRCYYEARAVCRHPSLSTTIRKYNDLKRVRIISARNKLILHDLHLDAWGRLGWRFKTLGKCLFLWLTFKLDFYQAFAQFVAKRAERKASKLRFRQVAATVGQLLSLQTIVQDLKARIDPHGVQKF